MKETNAPYAPVKEGRAGWSQRYPTTPEEASTRASVPSGTSRLTSTATGSPWAQDVIGLTYHELELLRVFFDQYDRVIPYKEITERIWGTSERTALRHLNVLVHRLRTKIASSYPYVIETVRGRGYGLLKAREAESAEGWPAGAEPAG